MATTYGMGGGTPIMSTTMPPPPSGMGGMTTPMATPMTAPMTTQNMGGMLNYNQNLPLASNRPIRVDENTPNLEEIQGFPVAGRSLDGTHFHQDPVTGQMYRMTDELHDRIPQILADRNYKTKLKISIPTKDGNMEYDVGELYKNFMVYSKNNSELVSQFYRSNRLDYLKNIEIENRTLETDSLKINDEFYYSDDIDVVTNDIVLYGDGTYKILGPSGIIRKELPVHDIIGEKINTPINKMLNTIPFPTYQLGSTQHTPINRFISLSQNLSSTNGMTNRYTPINKFYNIR